jgi:ribosome recycling factor
LEAEKKMKRLRMAKYSTELFDEIVIEMTKEKRTMMEMMAELDVDDEKILEAQQRITNKRLQAGLSISI